jgi:glycine cleavage system aminomethyltransferase T/glycine/D-amino acid oxidase-like deaminating enzyme
MSIANPVRGTGFAEGGPMALPSQARIVIVGGGIAGCSTAYHLAALGEKDVLLLEQGKLTCGTTWHAAGLIGQMRPNRTMTRMSKYGIELYATLEAETGLATGWKQCGSVNVAQTRERMMVLRKQLALARSFGVECEEISPARAGELFPPLRTDDLAGAIWIPGDGKANPADLTMSLAKGARNRGVRMVEGAEVVAVRSAASATGCHVTGLRVRHEGAEHEIACEIVVNCAGQWARQLGALAGVNVPLWSAEHFYIVTDRIDGVHPMLPVLRDPDGYIYYKEEVGGLLMGGFEPKAKPWRVDPIPATFQFELLDEDWDQFEPLLTAAIRRTPCLETARVKMLLNGPESFTPDGNFILGEAPELRRFYVAAGFNSAGIANAGGAGKLIAEWIAAGAPQSDLADVDIRRFGAHSANKRALAERTGETLGLHYAMRWPRQELETARPLRTSPLYDLLLARGAAFGAKNGWERASYFRSARDAAAPPYAHTLARPAWLDDVIREQRATRQAVALYDQTSFGKLLVMGRDALAVLQHLCANEMDVAPGCMVYTPMLNERGGFESDVTVSRLGVDRFLVVTGSAQAPRDLDWIARHIRPGEVAELVDASAMTAVLSLMGPNARALLGRVGAADTFAALGPERLKFSATREIDLGHARVRAARMSYVGGPGYELYVPIEMARHVYLALHAAGEDLGLADAGYYALDALRIEAGRRAWGAELGPDETPFEAGSMFAVRLDKQSDFIGRPALLALRDRPPAKKLVTIVFGSADAYAWGGESLLLDGAPVGEIASVGWSAAAGRCVGLGYLRGAAAATAHAGTPLSVDLWGEPHPAAAWDRWAPAARGARVTGSRRRPG